MLMVTVIAFNTGESTVQFSAIKIAHDHIHNIGSPEPVTLLIAIILYEPEARAFPALQNVPGYT